jgi:hypothetical protein
MERKEKQRLVLAAANHNAKARTMASCTHLYMGSMATASLISKLGGKYGKDSLTDLVERATDRQLDAGLESCASIIKHGKIV